MTLAWHLMLERSRYEGEDFVESLKQAFEQIEKKYAEDNEQHKRIREEVIALRKELNLE